METQTLNTGFLCHPKGLYTIPGLLFSIRPTEIRTSTLKSHNPQLSGIFKDMYLDPTDAHPYESPWSSARLYPPFQAPVCDILNELDFDSGNCTPSFEPGMSFTMADESGLASRFDCPMSPGLIEFTSIVSMGSLILSSPDKDFVRGLWSTFISPTDANHPELGRRKNYQEPQNDRKCHSQPTTKKINAQNTTNHNARIISFTKNTQSMETKKTSLNLGSRRCRPTIRSLGSTTCGGGTVGVC